MVVVGSSALCSCKKPCSPSTPYLVKAHPVSGGRQGGLLQDTVSLSELGVGLQREFCHPRPHSDHSHLYEAGTGDTRTGSSRTRGKGHHCPLVQAGVLLRTHHHPLLTTSLGCPHSWVWGEVRTWASLKEA